MLATSMPASPAVGYTRHELLRLLGLSEAQLARYLADGVVEPRAGEDEEDRFSFQDVVLLRAAESLRSSRVPERRIRSALSSLRRQLPPGRPPSAVRFAAHGREVVVRDGPLVWNPESGQELFEFAVGDLVDRVAPAVESVAREPQDAGKGPSAQEWYELACELEQRSAEEAEQAYRKALALDPDHAETHLNLGRLCHEREDLEAAERHYRAALEIDPEDATAAFNLGVALEDDGRDGEALEAYERAMANDPESADAFYNAARLYDSRGDRSAAMRCLQTCRRLRREGAGSSSSSRAPSPKTG